MEIRTVTWQMVFAFIRCDTGIEDYVTVGEMSSVTLDHCIRYLGAEKKNCPCVSIFII